MVRVLCLTVASRGLNRSAFAASAWPPSHRTVQPPEASAVRPQHVLQRPCYLGLSGPRIVRPLEASTIRPQHVLQRPCHLGLRAPNRSASRGLNRSASRGLNRSASRGSSKGLVISASQGLKAFSLRDLSVASKSSDRSTSRGLNRSGSTWTPMASPLNLGNLATTLGLQRPQHSSSKQRRLRDESQPENPYFQKAVALRSSTQTTIRTSVEAKVVLGPTLHRTCDPPKVAHLGRPSRPIVQADRSAEPSGRPSCASSFRQLLVPPSARVARSASSREKASVRHQASVRSVVASSFVRQLCEAIDEGGEDELRFLVILGFVAVEDGVIAMMWLIMKFSHLGSECVCRSRCCKGGAACATMETNSR
ncbi:hypothetical protein LR48_Vigan04g053800 [Vigna angularis]|uniref:Uncharacterized protein n=1 Tax=Phaseolus angularis TaxID=3914 RepID=A0A0L9UBM2_PHAAN|nr:hypothetical protein LR48_Vigan04g053800 [Vigna angularis]